jgi:hypothetical protein
MCCFFMLFVPSLLTAATMHKYSRITETIKERLEEKSPRRTGWLPRAPGCAPEIDSI